MTFLYFKADLQSRVCATWCLWSISGWCWWFMVFFCTYKYLCI